MVTLFRIGRRRSDAERVAARIILDHATPPRLSETQAIRIARDVTAATGLAFEPIELTHWTTPAEVLATVRAKAEQRLADTDRRERNGRT